MDAVEFIRERNRMCKYSRGCNECPADGRICSLMVNDTERLVQVVEEWAKEHPHKTRQSEFLKQYPNAVLDKDGVLRICPSFVGGDTHEKYKCICLTDCGSCRQEFWMQEVE